MFVGASGTFVIRFPNPELQDDIGTHFLPLGIREDMAFLTATAPSQRIGLSIED